MTTPAIKLATKLKHIDVHQHWLRQEVQEGRLLIEWIPTSEMPADGLTKALNRQKHQIFIQQLGLVDIKHLIQTIKEWSFVSLYQFSENWGGVLSLVQFPLSTSLAGLALYPSFPALGPLLYGALRVSYSSQRFACFSLLFRVHQTLIYRVLSPLIPSFPCITVFHFILNSLFYSEAFIYITSW